MFNVSTFLDNHMLRFPEKTALIHPRTNRAYTYTDLYQMSGSLAAAFPGLGLSPGDRAVLYLDSSPEYLISYFALWRAGLVVVPTNIVYRKEELAYAVCDSGAKLLISSAGSRGITRAVKDLCPSIMHILEVGGEGANSWERLAGSHSPARPVPCPPGKVCQIQYTSGTTGRPKGAMLTHDGWLATLQAEEEALMLTCDDIYLGIYPMAHVGISWGLSVLRAGGTFVIMERYSPEEYINLTRDYRITVLAGMPPVIHALTETPPGTEDKFSSVRCIISGGGPMHSPTWKKFNERFKIPVINAYGLSETIVLGCGTVIRPEDYLAADDYNSVGKPAGYSEVKIVDTADPSHELESPKAGEIALRGPGLALGYWNMPEETKEVFLEDGWFLTGDIGYIDSHGMLVITDRKKDMIIMSGWKVYPTEVENVLINHPKIADVAIFGCPDEEKSEIPAAAVVLRDKNDNLTLDELSEWCREFLAGYKIPRRLIILNQLPRVGGWKLLRKDLRDSLCS
ncbi:MAG TPA: class I adenylate-forming enzyme family protein [Methanospirillum sp.]|uniref:class I adenylate-forming enzyme family protein n=1 Tax=Methanospirillum sp. TaxID=45200 RepID=UPI002CB81AE7|nr:class I adenylate-forming enzyme family protein [Methanospirillum sp.]HPY59848.1 class I adenylate-forming enzyme family protein [Methanospirillum sp.]